MPASKEEGVFTLNFWGFVFWCRFYCNKVKMSRVTIPCNSSFSTALTRIPSGLPYSPSRMPVPLPHSFTGSTECLLRSSSNTTSWPLQKERVTQCCFFPRPSPGHLSLSYRLTSFYLCNEWFTCSPHWLTSSLIKGHSFWSLWSQSWHQWFFITVKYTHKLRHLNKPYNYPCILTALCAAASTLTDSPR